MRYYDDILREKLLRWIPETSNLRVLAPDDTKKLFETIADDTKDAAFKLPFIALSRSNSIEMISAIKQAKSFDGLTLAANKEVALKLNVIPIKLEYQLDIYTKTVEEGDEYLRNFLFKLINNPAMVITIPYNGTNIQHIVNIRVLDTISNTSDIPQHLYTGQFNRWTIQLELQDTFLFSIPYRRNWQLDGIDLTVNVEPGVEKAIEQDGFLEVSEHINEEGELEMVFNELTINN